MSWQKRQMKELLELLVFFLIFFACLTCMTCMKRCKKSRKSCRKTPASTMPWGARSVPIFPSDGDSVWKWWQEEAQRATLSMLCLGWFVRDSRMKKAFLFCVFFLRNVKAHLYRERLVIIGVELELRTAITMSSRRRTNAFVSPSRRGTPFAKLERDQISFEFSKKNYQTFGKSNKTPFCDKLWNSKELLFCSEMTFDELNGLMVLLAIRDPFWNGSIGSLHFCNLCRSQSEHEKLCCQNLWAKYLKFEKQKQDMDHVDTQLHSWAWLDAGGICKSPDFAKIVPPSERTHPEQVSDNARQMKKWCSWLHVISWFLM